MQKNMVRPQLTIRRMRIIYWITKATNTQSEYTEWSKVPVLLKITIEKVRCTETFWSPCIIFPAFPRLQLLLQRASMLHLYECRESCYILLTGVTGFKRFTLKIASGIFSTQCISTIRGTNSDSPLMSQDQIVLTNKTLFIFCEV